MNINLKDIFEKQESYVNEIIADIRKHKFSWDILQYANEYAEIEIDHDSIDRWNKKEYENGDFEFNEIRVHYGAIYRYVNFHGNGDYANDDSEEEMMEWVDNSYINYECPT